MPELGRLDAHLQSPKPAVSQRPAASQLHAATSLRSRLRSHHCSWLPSAGRRPQLPYLDPFDTEIGRFFFTLQKLEPSFQLSRCILHIGVSRGNRYFFAN